MYDVTDKNTKEEIQLEHIDMVKDFSQLINESKGKIVFLSSEGDRLVADSMLSALVGFSTILNAAKTIQLTYACEDETDCMKLKVFIQKYNLNCQPAE